jgi:hypothetical protein
VSPLPKPPEQTHIRPPDRVSLWWCWLDQGAGGNSITVVMDDRRESEEGFWQPSQ